MKYAVYANGTFWGIWAADSEAEAIQMAADEGGTIDIGEDRANTDGLTAVIVTASDAETA